MAKATSVVIRCQVMERILNLPLCIDIQYTICNRSTTSTSASTGPSSRLPELQSSSFSPTFSNKIQVFYAFFSVPVHTFLICAPFSILRSPVSTLQYPVKLSLLASRILQPAVGSPHSLSLLLFIFFFFALSYRNTKKSVEEVEYSRNRRRGQAKTKATRQGEHKRQRQNLHRLIKNEKCLSLTKSKYPRFYSLSLSLDFH